MSRSYGLTGLAAIAALQSGTMLANRENADMLWIGRYGPTVWHSPGCRHISSTKCIQLLLALEQWGDAGE